MCIQSGDSLQETKPQFVLYSCLLVLKMLSNEKLNSLDLFKTQNDIFSISTLTQFCQNFFK